MQLRQLNEQLYKSNDEEGQVNNNIGNVNLGIIESGGDTRIRREYIGNDRLDIDNDVGIRDIEIWDTRNLIVTIYLLLL